MPVSLQEIELQHKQDLHLKIAIGGSHVTRVEGQRHLAFVVGNNSGENFLYHLGSHNKFKCELLVEGYAANDEDFLDPYSANAIIGFLATLYDESKGRIPYSIEYSAGEYFADSGAQLKTEHGDGLTCATFVLEVLSRYGNIVLDRSTWPQDDAENAKWQQWIINAIARSCQGEPIDTFLAQVKKIGNVARFRPEEVMAATCEFEDEPLTFQQVAGPAQQVVDQMQLLGIG